MNKIVCEKISSVEINVEKINHNFVLFFYEEHLSGTISTHMYLGKKNYATIEVFNVCFVELTSMQLQ